jgi:hypothetical protein
MLLGSTCRRRLGWRSAVRGLVLCWLRCGTLAGMGVLTDYFSAPSDAAAASALDRAGGPGQPAAGPPPLPPFDTFQAKSLDPSVIMGKLEEALTGADYRVITAGPHYVRLVAQGGAHGPWVATVSSALQAALSLAGRDTLARAAAQWSQAEELRGFCAEDLTWILEELSGLARRATARDEHLYCWICL